MTPTPNPHRPAQTRTGELPMVSRLLHKTGRDPSGRLEIRHPGDEPYGAPGRLEPAAKRLEGALRVCPRPVSDLGSHPRR